jgi:1-acyl-sn-glycerol-3-phosphate acyltransferase
MVAWLVRAVLRICGWRLVGQLPKLPKYVIIAAPHTSNWDFPMALAMAAAFRIKVAFMMKDEMFRPPFGWLFRALGGIPINRRSHNNVVEQMVERFRTSRSLMLLITPEGTRSKVAAWKTGFYYIAQGAAVPIVLGFADFKRKVCGFGPVVWPTGGLDTDMTAIRAFYSGISGKRPEQFGEIAVPHEFV